jgi:hypothetical protein
MSMSQSRFDAIFSGQSSIAKKVYDAVPIVESWTAKKILSELSRQGITQDPRTITGCLDTLKRSGLIHEFMKGEFRREVIKELSAKAEVPAEKEPAPASKPIVVAPPPVEPEISAMDILGALAARAAHLSSMASDLSSDISDAAVEIQQRIETIDADTQKLRQLQSILKSIGP